jgi:hypothetical protein
MPRVATSQYQSRSRQHPTSNRSVARPVYLAGPRRHRAVLRPGCPTSPPTVSASASARRPRPTGLRPRPRPVSRHHHQPVLRPSADITCDRYAPTSGPRRIRRRSSDQLPNIAADHSANVAPPLNRPVLRPETSLPDITTTGTPTTPTSPPDRYSYQRFPDVSANITPTIVRCWENYVSHMRRYVILHYTYVTTTYIGLFYRHKQECITRMFM